MSSSSGSSRRRSSSGDTAGPASKRRRRGQNTPSSSVINLVSSNASTVQRAVQQSANNVINLVSSNNNAPSQPRQRTSEVRPAELPHARANSPVQPAPPAWLQTRFGALDLKPHQVAASMLFARASTPGLLLYYKVGSGKTLAAVAAAENLAIRENRSRTVVVVVPASLRDNFRDQMNAALAGGGRQRYEIHSFHGVHGWTAEKRRQVATGAVLIVDEVQNLRNPANNRGKPGETSNRRTMLDSVMEMARVAHKRLLLSGTPVMNYPIDIGSLLALLDPANNEARALKTWQQTAQGYTRAVPAFQKRYGKDASRRRDELRAMMRCTTLFYEPPPAELARHYPTKTEHEVRVTLSPEQAAAHLRAAAVNPGPRSMEDVLRMVEESDDYQPTDSVMFLVGPRQINNRHKNRHAKIDAAVARVVARHQGSSSAKFLIYSFWLKAGLVRIAELLRARGVPCDLFTGEMSAAEKSQAVRRYNAGQVRVLLISDAGKEGLDLKGTSEVHVMEPGWNEDKIQQVIGRAVRYGSHDALPQPQRHVDVYRYVAVLPEGRRGTNRDGVLMERTADEILWELSRRKHQINREFLNWIIAISDQNRRQCL